MQGPPTLQNDGSAGRELDQSCNWLISLTFWIVLFSAAAIYAAVALSPKLAVHLHLERRHYRNQVQLVRLEYQIEDLERVARALESDSEFAAELARLEFDAEKPGDERIGVDSDLQLDARTLSQNFTQQTGSIRWYESMVETVATGRHLRTICLLTAVISVILAFTFLQESQLNRIRSGIGAMQTLAQWISRRYHTPGG